MALTKNAQVEEQKRVACSTGERIAAYRKVIRVDQKELACRLGVKPSTMNHWETGYTPISVYDLKRVAQALRIPASWFLDENATEEAEIHSLHLQQRFRHLTAQHQGVLLTLLQELLRIQGEASASDVETDMNDLRISEDCRPQFSENESRSCH